MANDDLLAHAKSSEDFYALLGEDIHPGSSEKEIARAYRRAALKSHPDKHKDDPGAVARFHALQIAYDVLCDPAAKAAYDNARLAREAKKRQDEMFQGRRRAMKEDLERRESGAFRKRKRDAAGGFEEEDAEVVLEREIRRLAEDGRRRRLEREEALRKEAEVLERMEGGDEALGSEGTANNDPMSASTINGNGMASGGSNVSEINRTVKVRWPREGKGQDMDKEMLASLFRKFGPIESTLILKDKKMRVGGEHAKKKIMGTAFIVYKSVVGAHAAVEDMGRQSGEEWDLFESIEWAEGKTPDFLDSFTGSSAPSKSSSLSDQRHSQDSVPSTPLTQSSNSHGHPSQTESKTPMTPLETIKARLAAAAANQQNPNNGSNNTSTTTKTTTSSSTSSNNDNLRKVPSFASFSSSKFDSPANTPFKSQQHGLGGSQSPSLEEITLIRLKNAERKRMEEEIRAREARGEGEEVGLS